MKWLIPIWILAGLAFVFLFNPFERVFLRTFTFDNKLPVDVSVTLVALTRGSQRYTEMALYQNRLPPLPLIPPSRVNVLRHSAREVFYDSDDETPDSVIVECAGRRLSIGVYADYVLIDQQTIDKAPEASMRGALIRDMRKPWLQLASACLLVCAPFATIFIVLMYFFRKRTSAR